VREYASAEAAARSGAETYQLALSQSASQGAAGQVFSKIVPFY